MGQNSIKQNAILSMIKRICMILFPLITIPYISRVLGADNYGKLSFANSISGYVSLVAGLGIGTYAVREGARLRENPEKFQKFTNEMRTISLLATGIGYVFLLIAVVWSAKLRNYWILLVIQNAGLLFAVFAAEWINTVYEDFAYITARYLVFQLLSLFCMFLFVKGPEDIYVYALIVAFATFGGAVTNIFYVRRYVLMRFTKHPNFRQHLGPILFLFFNSVAQVIYLNSDITMLGYMQTEEAVGIYSMSSKIYMCVKEVFNALTMAIVPRLALLLGKEEGNEFCGLLNKISNALMTLVLPGIVGLFFLSRDVIWLMGGVGYLNGTKTLQILSIALFFAVFACFYFNGILLPYRQERLCLGVSAISAAVNISLNFLLIPKLSYTGAALTTLFSEMIVFGIFYRASRSYPHERYNGRIILISLVGCAVVAVVCIACQRLISRVPLRVILSVLFGSSAYFAVCLLGGNTIVCNTVKGMLNKVLKR